MLRLSPRARGDDHPRARINADDVLELRRLRAEGWTLNALAARYGISFQAAGDIAKGKTWRHVVAAEAVIVVDRAPRISPESFV